ncbi:hypothetical protein [Burkholderia cenocepacia]|uniref:hypothetical protein n=1 Tax=Burkholderia cenocepacia TaxID=95486 RepID=UPI000760BCE7|nr:hypothetical protein [Burkholderia cenocepacia]KWU17762.1 hypothetical protein AS149_13665 [Burkholderia cenocepacia]
MSLTYDALQLHIQEGLSHPEKSVVTPPTGKLLDAFRDGIFQLKTRRFATVTEMLVQQLTGAQNPLNIHHDLYEHSTGTRLEVKFCVVRQRADDRIDESNVLQVIASAAVQNRRVAFSNWCDHQFTCNIQQVKRDEFDVLYYGLFFDDVVQVFRISSALINERVRFSKTQHKGNVGEGQFHITHHNLPIHLEQFHLCTLNYAEVWTLLAHAQNAKKPAEHCARPVPACSTEVLGLTAARGNSPAASNDASVVPVREAVSAWPSHRA